MGSSTAILHQNVDYKFWLTFEQAAVGMALIAPSGRYLRANPELCRLLDYTEEQLCALTFHDATHPDDRAASDILSSKLLSGALTTYRIEKRYVRRGGRVVWGLLSVSLVRDEAGAPMHFISVVQDVTECKIALQELEQARNRYQAICDDVGDFISINDLHGVILFAGTPYASLMGYTPAELVGADALRYIHPDDRPIVQDAYRQFVGGSNERLKMRYRAFRKDGAYVWLETYARPFNGVGGQAREVICVSREMSEQQQVEQTLTHDKQQAEERSQALGELALTDELTGLRNRRSIDESLGVKLSSRRSASFPIGCLLVDIDHFKELNDSYGPSVGDEALRRIARVLEDTCRDEDYVARYEGDEFLLVLPNTNPGGTIILGEKLIRNVRALDWSDLPLQGEVTVSIGATCINYGTNLTLPELLDILDGQLYQAKEAGRNRLVMNTRQTVGRMRRW